MQSIPGLHVTLRRLCRFMMFCGTVASHSNHGCDIWFATEHENGWAPGCFNSSLVLPLFTLFVLHVLRDDAMNDPNSLAAQLRRITPPRFVAYLGCSYSIACHYHLLTVIPDLPILAVPMSFVLGCVFWFVGEYNIDMQLSYCLTLSISAWLLGPVAHWLP